MGLSQEENRAYKATWARDKRKKSKEAGDCIQCGKLSDGKARCPECRKLQYAGQAETSAKRVAAGLCGMCGKEPATDTNLCDGCRKKALTRNESYRARCRRNGKCFLCGGEAKPGKLRCKKCQGVTNEQKKARVKNWIAAGLCTECGKNPVLEVIKNDGCVPSNPYQNDEKFRWCKRCYIRFMAKWHLGSRDKYQILLDKLDASDWRCHYSGRKLVLGTNLSFDHVLPVSRFDEKSRDPDNLVPVDTMVNFVKRNLTGDEFRTLAREIVSHEAFLSNRNREVYHSHARGTFDAANFGLSAIVSPHGDMRLQAGELLEPP